MVDDDAVLRVIVLLQRYSVGLTRLAADALGSGSASNRAVELLLAVHSHPDSTPAELAERTATSPSAVSRCLGRLADDGLVERCRSVRDGRSVRVRLTRAGRARVRRFEHRLDDFNVASGPVIKESLLAFGLDPVVPAGARRPAPLVTAARLTGLGAGYVEDTAAALAEFGITTGNERFAVCHLRARDRMLPSQLADELAIAHSTTTELIDRLEARDLVRREHASRRSDRRHVHLVLTPRGLGAAAVFVPAFREHAPRVLEALAETLAPGDG